MALHPKLCVDSGNSGKKKKTQCGHICFSDQQATSMQLTVLN